MDKTTIEVRFKYDEPPDNVRTSSEYETWVVGKLRAAGVPVIGVLAYRGIRHGTLTRTDDTNTGETIYRWRP